LGEHQLLKKEEKEGEEREGRSKNPKSGRGETIFRELGRIARKNQV